MARGTIKWFNPKRGFGFIRPETGGGDVLIRAGTVRDGQQLSTGRSVTFDPEANPSGNVSAVNIKMSGEKG